MAEAVPGRLPECPYKSENPVFHVTFPPYDLCQKTAFHYQPTGNPQCESIDDDGQFRHNSSVHLLKKDFPRRVYQTPRGGASHHHVTYPLIDNSRKTVYGYDQRVEIFGSKGMACTDNNYPENHRYFASDGVHGSLPLNFFMDRYLEAYANEMKIFCDAVTNNLKLPVDGNDGLMSVAIALAAKKSHLEHRPVKLSEII